MTHVVNDGLSLAQATGRKLRDGVGAVAMGVRDQVGAAAHLEPAAHKPERPASLTRLAGLVASAAGALTAFFVSRLVRSRLNRHGK